MRYFRELARTLGLDLRPLTRARIAAVGRTTAAAVKTLGLGITFQPTRPDATTLARELPHIKNRRVLLLRADIASTEPAGVLRSRLAEVTDLPIYGTVPATERDPAYEPLLTYSRVAAHVVASPSAALGITLCLSEPALIRARALPAVAVGPTTASALTTAGFGNVLIATEPSIPAILSLLPVTM